MLRSFSIIRFISGLLLLVFVLGITPKIYLHDAFAKHVDNSVKKRSDVPVQLGKSGYNCDCNDLVAESTFVSDQLVFSFPLLTSFSDLVFKQESFWSIAKTYSLLRGPPVNI